MTTFNRRGLHPILDHHDCKAANDELIAMRAEADSLTGDDLAYMDELQAGIDHYLEYCPADSLQATPSSLLMYLFQYVRPNCTVEAAGNELGITDLRTVYNGFRAPTDADKRKLVEYFGVSADAFDGLLDHQLDA
jgi:hypothetical protein